MAEGVTIITPTGGRPQALALCRRYVARQDHEGPIQWIVVDDGEVPSPELKQPAGVELRLVRPAHRWGPGRNTLALNLLAALPLVAHEIVMFFEDDDWYAPGYVTRQVARLSAANIAGEVPARYYHVPSALWRVFSNTSHASLAQTAVRRSVLPVLREVCERSAEYVDVNLWGRVPSGRDVGPGHLCIGMKGLPGRPGIGVGHRPEGSGWQADTGGLKLRGWVGEDAARYDVHELRQW